MQFILPISVVKTKPDKFFDLTVPALLAINSWAEATEANALSINIAARAIGTTL